MANIDDFISTARDSITVKRVYGDPFEKDGVTLIPAAAVRGGAGGREGDADGGDSTGSGGGFGMSARPVGAYEIKDGVVRWVPAADTTRVIISSQIVAVVALLVAGVILRSRRGTT